MNININAFEPKMKKTVSSNYTIDRPKVIKKVVPGTLIVEHSENIESGVGTYIFNGNIYSSMCGQSVMYLSEAETNNQTGESPKIIYSVISKNKKKLVPEIGNVVTCKCIKTSQHKAIVEIQKIGDSDLPMPILGEINFTDIQRIVTDKVTVSKSFSVGDVIRSKVTALGSSNFYILSTASQELGVIEARCATTMEKMIPVSWQEMQCPISGAKEYRKVAKPKSKSTPNNHSTQGAGP